MSFIKKIWKDRLVLTPNRRKLTDIDTQDETVVDIEREEGEILEVGDRFDAPTMNNLELRIDEGFKGLHKVSKSGDYKDLENKPDLKALENRVPAPYEEGDLPLYETPTDVLYKPADGSVYNGNIAIVKYRDDSDSISTGIFLKDEGSELFNFKTQAVKMESWTDDVENMGVKAYFADGSYLMWKPTYVSGVFTGIKYSTGDKMDFVKKSGPFPDFE